MNGQSCAFVPSVDLLPVQADRRRRFALQPAHNELRDDTLKIGLTPTSLLTTGDVTAVDQTGQIIVDLAGVAGAAAGVGRKGDGAKDDGCQGPAVWAPSSTLSKMGPSPKSIVSSKPSACPSFV